MAPKLPPIGVEAIVKGFDVFGKNLDSVNKRIQESSDKAKAAAKTADPLSKSLDKVGFSFDSIKDKLADFAGVSTEAVDGLGGILDGILPIGPAALIAVAGVAALVAGFIALGNRGAPLQELGRAFDSVTASVGLTSKSLLVDLRKASDGTVSDFDLIRTANTALVGEVGKFGKALGGDLPKLLEIARVASDATGKSIDETFNTLVEGVKKGTARQLKSVGIIVNATEANNAYAESIGKSSAQLTEEEKRIALLNATLVKGQDILNQSANIQESNADKLDRINATITNIFDGLAIAIQPAFGTVLDVANRILGIFQQVEEALAPILGAIASIITTTLGAIFDTVLTIVQPIINAILSFGPYISIAFQAVANIFAKVRDVIQGVVGGIVKFIQDVAQHLFGIDINNLGKNLFEGAAHIFGAFANGIIKVANVLIFPAVIGIAQFIADLLVGFSPPKKGPLSQIDKGGENIMLAWLDGITGVSLDPVDQVAAQVDAALGDIGKESLPQVDARLAQLDKALLPFQNRLDIVKSQFDAISAPAQAALDAIDRQLADADAALASGDQAAAERVRSLDAARDAIQGQLDAQQKLVDQQQIQLGLAQASQAQERTLLTIRKAALEASQKGMGTAPGGAKAGTTPKEAAAKGGAGAPVEAEGSAAGIAIPQQGTVLDLFGGQDAVNTAIAGIQDSFASEIDTSALGDFQANSGKLKTQLDRIGSVDLGKKLSDKFKGLGDIFDPNIKNSPANVVSRFFSADPTTPGSLSGFVNSIGPTLDSLKTSVQASATEFFDSIFNPARAGSPASIVQTLFADSGTEGSIAYSFAQLGPALQAAAPAIQDSLTTSLSNIFDPSIPDSPAGIITGLIQQITGDETVTSSVASFFSEMPQHILDSLAGLLDDLQTQIFDPVSNFLTGSGDGTLSGILDQAVQFFTDFPSKIIAGLQGFGAAIYTAVAIPVITVINSLIELIEGGIKSFISAIAGFISGITDGIDGLGLGINTAGLHNIVADLNSKAGSVSFGRISTALPAFLVPQVPGAATGGMFGKGMLKVGERGPEYIGAASKIGVLPAALTRVLDNLGGILAQPAPMMIPAGDTYNSNSSTYNFHGVQSDNDARRRYNSLRAGMR